MAFLAQGMPLDYGPLRSPARHGADRTPLRACGARRLGANGALGGLDARHPAPHLAFHLLRRLQRLCEPRGPRAKARAGLRPPLVDGAPGGALPPLAVVAAAPVASVRLHGGSPQGLRAAALRRVRAGRPSPRGAAPPNAAPRCSPLRKPSAFTGCHRPSRSAVVSRRSVSSELWEVIMRKFLRGFGQGVRETPVGYFAPVLMVWRAMRWISRPRRGL